MQVRQFFVFTVLVFFLFPIDSAFAQKLTTNEKGEKIVVYPDGSWHYFDGASPEVINPPATKETEAPNNKKKSKKTKKKKKSTPGKISAKQESMGRRKAIIRADQAAAEEENARLAEEEAIFKRIFLEEELEDAYQSMDMTHEDIADIEVRLKAAKQSEADLRAIYEKARDKSKTFEKMIDMPESKRTKLLAKMESVQSNKDAIADNVSVDKTDIPFQQDNYESTNTQNRPPVRAYNPKSNLLLNPPPRPCKLVFDDVDAFSGKKRKETAKTKFFTHTPERFRSYFKGRDYITCQGAIIQLDGTPRSLNFEFTIATEQATREFGVLEKGSQLILRLINGRRIILINNKTATGIADPITKTTRYTAQYLLNKGQIKSLREAEVDKVRMIWATGYEDYEVYEVDYFRDLFKCLEQ